MSDTVVKAQNLSKRFYVLKSQRTFLKSIKAFIQGSRIKEQMWVLKDISFEIKRGQKIALLGKNGCGKTTLLRILTGIYSKSSGYLEVSSSPASLFKFSIGVCADLSVLDNIYLFGAVYGLDREFLKAKMDDILKMAEITRLAFSPWKELSAGQKSRVVFSVFSQVKSEFLIFDESLSLVDQGFREKCKAYFQNLLSSEKTIIMTSQDNSFLSDYCKDAIWIDQGKIRMSGPVRDVINEYERSFLA